MTRNSWCEQLENKTHYDDSRETEVVVQFKLSFNRGAFVYSGTVGTRGRTTPPSPAMQWMPTQLRSTVCPSIPTVSLSWPLALQIRWVQLVHVAVKKCTFCPHSSSWISWSWPLFYLDGGSLGPEEPEAETALIWVSQGRDLPGKKWNFGWSEANLATTTDDFLNQESKTL